MSKRQRQEAVDNQPKKKAKTTTKKPNETLAEYHDRKTKQGRVRYETVETATRPHARVQRTDRYWGRSQIERDAAGNELRHWNGKKIRYRIPNADYDSLNALVPPSKGKRVMYTDKNGNDKKMLLHHAKSNEELHKFIQQRGKSPKVETVNPTQFNTEWGRDAFRNKDLVNVHKAVSRTKIRMGGTVT